MATVGVLEIGEEDMEIEDVEVTRAEETMIDHADQELASIVAKKII
jgi:hypothetical protein